MRKLTSAALALALAGGVYLGATSAEASNMGFKLERSFAYVNGAKNLYYVSFPLFNGLGDISDGTTCGGSDGVVNVRDALCDFATSVDDSAGGALMTIQKLDVEGTAGPACGFVAATLLKNPATGAISFVGGWSEDLTTGPNREIGLIVNVTKGPADPAGIVLDNRAVIVGSHDPSFPGRTISRACAADYLNLPYHTMYRTADEILCGLEGVDWMPDGSGNPDACDNGIYDPVSGVSVTLQTFVNDVPPVGGFQGRTVFNAGGLRFVGSDYDLTPGDAYLFSMNVGYQDRNWLSPHF